VGKNLEVLSNSGSKEKMILPKNINKIGVDCICRISFMVILHLVFFSCTSNQTAEKTLFVDDIDLKLAHEQEIDIKLASLGIIDITDLTSKEVLDNLNLKIARSSTNIGEMFSIVLLDKNRNGLHSDLNVDLIALAPNQWDVLDGRRFSYLNCVPFKENQSIFIYDHFETIIELNEELVRTSLSEPTDNFTTFPYTIPPLLKTTVKGDVLNFIELTESEKLIFFEFWGTWCKGCVQQIPDLKELYDKYNDKIVIIGINEKDKIEKVKAFTQQFEMNWPQIKMDEQISKSFGEEHAFPLGVLFDQNGRLIGYGIKPKKIITVLSRSE
jgi:thiol-disulfide isomerase/thioredoxin